MNLSTESLIFLLVIAGLAILLSGIFAFFNEDGGTIISIGAAVLAIAILISSIDNKSKEKVKDIEFSDTFIQTEANRLFDVTNARVVESLGNDKYEVVAGDDVYHAYFDKDAEKVNFIKMGSFER